MTDPREQYQRAWQSLLDVAEQVPAERWDAPSPCAGWTARQLAGHVMDGARQVHVMVTGEPPLVPITDPDALADLAGPDPAGVLRADVARLQEAVDGLASDAVAETPQGSLPLPEFLTTALVEPVVHGWDLAVATGQSTMLAPDLVAALLPGVLQLGDQLAATGRYAAALPLPDSAPASERLLAALGRRST